MKNHRTGQARQVCPWLIQQLLRLTATTAKVQHWEEASMLEEGWGRREPPSVRLLGTATRKELRAGCGQGAGQDGRGKVTEKQEKSLRLLSASSGRSQTPSEGSVRGCLLHPGQREETPPLIHVPFLLIRIPRSTDINFGPIFNLGGGGI